MGIWVEWREIRGNAIALLNFAISGLCEARRREFREITRADMKYKIPGEITRELFPGADTRQCLL